MDELSTVDEAGIEPHEQTAPCDPTAESVVRRGPWLQFRVPRGFEWNRYEIPVPGLPPEFEGVRIAHITDLHLKGFWSSAYDELVSRVQQEAPDLILMTGDFVDNKRNHLPAVPHVLRLLRGLSAPLGCFGILGNHDRYSLGPRLEGSGMTLLDAVEGRRWVIERNGSELELIGLPGVDRKDLTPEVLNAYPRRCFGVPRIVLAHFPDQIRKTGALQPDIFLTGHTHGGQICLPGRMPILRHDSLPRRLCSGIHRAADTWLVVSRGIGFTGLPLRVFCPSEVIEIRLTRG